MIFFEIPGFKNEIFKIDHLLLDFNGTLAIDGKLMDGVKEKLKILSKKLKIHVLTGNTFETAQKELEGLPCKLVLLPKKNQCIEKANYTKAFEKDSVIAIGNGRNDLKMLQMATIGIVVIQTEGTALASISKADVIYKNILDALDALNNPLRLKATLRG